MISITEFVLGITLSLLAVEVQAQSIEELIVGTNIPYFCFQGTCERCRFDDQCPLPETFFFRCIEIPLCPFEEIYPNQESCERNCPIKFECWDGLCMPCADNDCGDDPYISFDECSANCFEDIGQAMPYTCAGASCIPCKFSDQTCQDQYPAIPFFCETLAICEPPVYSSEEQCSETCNPAYFFCPLDGSSGCIVCIGDDCPEDQDIFATIEDCESSCSDPEINDEICQEADENSQFYECQPCVPTCNPVEFTRGCESCTSGCNCKHGFVRHKGACISMDKCPQCPANSFWTECACRHSCEEPAFCVGCTEGCECNPGLLQAPDLSCVMPSMCPKPIFYQCGLSLNLPEAGGIVGTPFCAPCSDAKNKCDKSMTLYNSAEMCINACPTRNSIN